ncbi:MAG: DEAD/DEAH box helicase [Candidatus Aenigmatarchaeota archaeon]
MKIDELKNYGFESKWIEKIKKLNIHEFYPPQEDFIKRKMFEKSCIVSSPTASGKTLLAVLSSIKTLEGDKKILYTSPLISLAFEKYEEFKNFFNEYKVAISVSDFDSNDPWLQNYDIVIATNEKVDSLIRHDAFWIRDVGLLIVDEIHMLNDLERGATLEILITKMKKIIKRLKILGLSATIKNCKELAKWLSCEVIESNFRAVKLNQGVAFNNKVKFLDKKEIILKEDSEIEETLVEDTLKKGKQTLIFCSTRRNTENLAERLSKFVKNKLGKSDISILNKIANEIEDSLEVPTKQCKKLAECIRRGVAFHHSGLVGKQRRIIEENFKNGLIKVLVATTSLAYGVNLPAFRVIMRDVKRYHPLFGYVYIPIIEYYQMIGRAGRPNYDSYGESIILAKDEDEAEILFDKFINGEPEQITSRLASEPALRMHTLALIASDFCKSKESLLEFFNSTFFAYKYGDLYIIEEKIEEFLENFKKWNFIEIREEKIEATKLGKRISQLYLDPLTGKLFVDALNSKKEFETFNTLQLISFSYEMRPLPSIKTSEISEIDNEIERNRDKIFLEVDNNLEIEELEKSVKMAKIFNSWINEMTEEEILEKFSLTPGELYSKLQIADWLLYSLHELALLLNKKDVLRKINKLRLRIQKGVKEELLQLVSLEGIGRIRARKLYNIGLKNLEDLKKVPLETLSKIIGEKTARKIKAQIEGKNETKEKQKTLI